MALTLNRLIREKSPYLLQHARNPVDWYPWGAEAFHQARLLDKPLFLSVGYSSCHWCHVMERESFENESLAQLLNHYFIPVKVDREERPDVDEVYMTAVQLASERGGWPMSVFMTPDGEPFYAGTYFPPHIFEQVLKQLGEAWKHRRPEILETAREITQAVQQISGLRTAQLHGEPDFQVVSLYLHAMMSSFDSDNAGFGQAPKFPPNLAFPVLFYLAETLHESSAAAMAFLTLNAMMMGGIHDHVGGGFHRYSTDREWLLPHFEKMLYDNAQLGWAYTKAYELTGEPSYSDTAARLLDWVLQEMRVESAFAGAIDADSEGEEGKYYTWTLDEIYDALGEKEAELFCEIYSIQTEGNYREEATQALTGRNIPNLKQPLQLIAETRGMNPEELQQHVNRSLTRLQEIRATREKPMRDDKIITGWNGMMIGALAYASTVLENVEYLRAAEQAAEFLLKHLRDSSGRLLRRYREGDAAIPAFLEDYALFGEGLVKLYEAGSEERWLLIACELADHIIEQFRDQEFGAFFSTGTQHEPLIARVKDAYDKSMPGGNGAAARFLAQLCYALTVEGDIERGDYYERYARETISSLWALVARAPSGAESLLYALLILDGSELESLPELPGSSRQEGEEEGPLSIQILPQEQGLAVYFLIEDNWHIHTPNVSQPHLISTQVHVLTDLPLTVGEPLWSPPGPYEVAGEALMVYREEAAVLVPIVFSGSAGDTEGEIHVRVIYQPCNDTECLAPEEKHFVLPVRLQQGGESER
jgi:uncharacterized protein YyaL (SSP411 family)